MTFRDSQPGAEPGEPLGMAAYFVRLLEIGGLVLGGMVVPLVMMRRPYCEACQRYQTTSYLGLIPIEPIRPAGGAVDPDLAAKESSARRERFRRFAEAGDVDAFLNELEPFLSEHRAIAAMRRRTRLQLNYCRSCLSGRLEIALLVDKGDNVEVELLPGANVGPAFVTGMGLR